MFVPYEICGIVPMAVLRGQKKVYKKVEFKKKKEEKEKVGFNPLKDHSSKVGTGADPLQTTGLAALPNTHLEPHLSSSVMNTSPGSLFTSVICL